MNTSIYQQYLQLKAEHPYKYARDLATLMGISEAELIHSRVGQGAKRLKADIRRLLAGLKAVGEIKAITRNAYAVHEQLGCYDNQHLDGHAGLVLNPRDLDLRLFLNQWASAFTLTEETRHGVRQSIQFFSHQGDALHKVYVTEHTDMQAWQALLAAFITTENPELQLERAGTAEAAEPTVTDEHVDTEWRAMTDAHQFFQLLKRNNLTRQQAFRAVGDDLAYQVDNRSLAQLLELAQQQQNELMIFIGNRGCIQIFTGKIEKVMPQQGWMNIFNPRFTLHLIETAIAESWITRKPTKDGFVTSLELFAADGTHIAQIYGHRIEGQPEQAQWREQIARPNHKDIAA